MCLWTPVMCWQSIRITSEAGVWNVVVNWHAFIHCIVWPASSDEAGAEQENIEGSWAKKRSRISYPSKSPRATESLIFSCQPLLFLWLLPPGKKSLSYDNPEFVTTTALKSRRQIGKIIHIQTQSELLYRKKLWNDETVTFSGQNKSSMEPFSGLPSENKTYFFDHPY